MRVLTAAGLTLTTLLATPAHAHPHPEFGVYGEGERPADAPPATRPDATAVTMGWDDGLSTHAPLRGGFSFAYHLVPAPTFDHFLDLHGSLPFHASKNGFWTVGLDVGIGATGLHVPSEDRGDFRLRQLTGELWFTFAGPKRLSRHGTGLNGGGPLMRGGQFWLDARETAGSIGLFYDGYIVTPKVDVALRFDGGANTGSILYALGSASVIVKAHPQVAVPIGVFGGTFGQAVAQVGVHGRPLPSVELGLDLAVPFTPSGRPWSESPVWPSVSVRVWDGRAGASAAAPWSARLKDAP